MKLSEFLDRIKLQNPNLGQQNISDTFLKTLLNQAVDRVNLLAKVYSTYTDFTIEADKRVYNFSTITPLYLGTDKRGLFFKDSDGNWTDIDPRTEDWIAEKYPDFLNASSVAIPDYYWIKGDELGFYPPPSTSYTSGGRLYHLKKSNPMGSNDLYPWTGSTTEITAFIPLDDAILAYVRWKLSPQFGNVSDVDLREREFVSECAKGAKQIKSSQHLVNDSGYNMSISA